MYTSIKNIEEFETQTQENDAVLVYFSHERCNVCKVLKPKIAELVSENFPKVKLFYADTELSPEVSAQQRIFAVPTLIVYFGGREYIRKSRNLSIDELAGEIERPYGMMFDS